jgi:hypothetical protein
MPRLTQVDPIGSIQLRSRGDRSLKRSSRVFNAQRGKIVDE